MTGESEINWMAWMGKLPFNHSRLARALCLVTAATSLFYQAACDKKPGRPDQNLAAEKRVREDFATHLDRSFEKYLQGDADQALRALKEMAQFAQDSKVNERIRAHALWLVYARLYVLDTHTHHDSLAEADLVNTRYWFLQEREQSGDNPEEAADAVQSMTGEKCEAIISKWDRDLTKGKGPEYLRLPDQRPESKPR